MHRPAWMLAVVSGKGGVGKTVLSVNLAVALGNAGPVVLFDGDAGLANAHILLGARPQLSIADAVQGTATIEQIAASTRWGIDLVAGSSGDPTLLAPTDAVRRTMQDALDALLARYALAIVDCPAGADESALRHTAAADEILVVITGDPTSFLDAYSTVKELNRRYKRKRFNLVLNLVENAFDAKNLFSRFQSVTSRFLDIELRYLGYVRRDRKVGDSIRSGMPLVEYAKGSPAASDLLAIARQLRERRRQATALDDAPDQIA